MKIRFRHFAARQSKVIAAFLEFFSIARFARHLGSLALYAWFRVHHTGGVVEKRQ
jgi:hypothetical protein